MGLRSRFFFWLIIPLLFGMIVSCDDGNGGEPPPVPLQLGSVSVGPVTLLMSGQNTGLATGDPIVIRFSTAVDTASARKSITLRDDKSAIVAVNYSFIDNFKTVSLFPQQELSENSLYEVRTTGDLKGSQGQTFSGFNVSFQTLQQPVRLLSVLLGSKTYTTAGNLRDIDLKPDITLTFSKEVNPPTVMQNTTLSSGGSFVTAIPVTSAISKVVVLRPETPLPGLSKCTLAISNKLTSNTGAPFEGFQGSFFTVPDRTPKFPVISDEELLTLIQRQTFKYFWDFGHPVSGLARERNTSGDVVTSGGSGFGLMAMVVAMERGFITRTQGVDRLKKIIDFLGQADRFHGAWPHWLNGATGKVYPFSTKDNGGDLVETSYLVAGLLTVRQYLNQNNTGEKLIIDKINALCNTVEWDWYTRNGGNVLYWHWSPNYQWEMNHAIRGYNEALITYIMAASSTQHGINSQVYHQGWASNGSIKNGKKFYDITLPLGYDYGGPLFFAHYTFLGINPMNLKDTYANYREQNISHSLINHAHSVANPNGFVGYYADCWGLTASDGNSGYSAHSPTNDKGVISPTAALSSFPFTPKESMDALKFFYYVLGDKLWGEYGFYDAFNPTVGWTANSFLAIDQGPVIIMIENHRTNLIWNLLMSCPEVQSGLTKLGFTY